MALFAWFLIITAVIVQEASAGIIYTRWGRKVCRPGAHLLYEGYMAGKSYNSAGNGGNHLCIRKNPKWGEGNVPGQQSGAAYIYGVEYEIHDGYSNNKPFSYANLANKDIFDNDAPCAVCYNPKASTHYMSAGRPDCPSTDMTLEYYGYLVADATMHQSTEYICLDNAPEVIPGGEANDNQAVLFPVQVVCGSLPCKDFVNFNELTCAVCSI